MKSATQFAATALLAIGATTITAGTAHATPVIQPALHGTDRGVTYVTHVDAGHAGVTTTLDAGTFSLAADARSVSVSDRAGTVVATLPMAFRVADRTFRLAPSIDSAGRTLTLTPVGATPAAPQPQFVDAAADLARHQYNAGVGALIGLGIGILIGGLGYLVGAIPGAIIGAGIGALIGWATP